MTDELTNEQPEQGAASVSPAPSSPSPESQTESAPISTDTGDLDRVRDLVLAANPDVVPELVQGDSIDALIASVDAARAAYQRIVDAHTPAATSGTPAPAPVGGQPGGDRQTYVVNVEELSPAAKIAEGLRRRNRG